MSEIGSTQVALLVADVYELAGALRRVGETIATEHGQTQARWQLLSAVSDQPRTVAQAARRLGVTRQAVQRVANDLVAGGMAEYRDNPDHRSSALLALTEAGRRALRDLTHSATEANEAIATRIDLDVLEATRVGVRALIAAVGD